MSINWSLPATVKTQFLIWVANRFLNWISKTTSWHYLYFWLSANDLSMKKTPSTKCFLPWEDCFLKKQLFLSVLLSIQKVGFLFFESDFPFYFIFSTRFQTEIYARLRVGWKLFVLEICNLLQLTINVFFRRSRVRNSSVVQNSSILETILETNSELGRLEVVIPTLASCRTERPSFR